MNRWCYFYNIYFFQFIYLVYDILFSTPSLLNNSFTRVHLNDNMLFAYATYLYMRKAMDDDSVKKKMVCSRQITMQCNNKSLSSVLHKYFFFFIYSLYFYKWPVASILSELMRNCILFTLKLFTHQE